MLQPDCPLPLCIIRTDPELEQCIFCSRTTSCACSFPQAGFPSLVYARAVKGSRASSTGKWARGMRQDGLLALATHDDEMLLFGSEPASHLATLLNEWKALRNVQVLIFGDTSHAPFRDVPDATFQTHDWFSGQLKDAYEKRWLTFARGIAQTAPRTAGVYVNLEVASAVRLMSSAIAAKLDARSATRPATLLKIKHSADLFGGKPTTTFSSHLDALIRDEFPEPSFSGNRRTRDPLWDDGVDQPQIAEGPALRRLGRSVVQASPWAYDEQAIVSLPSYSSTSATLHDKPRNRTPPPSVHSHFLEAHFPDCVLAQSTFKVTCALFLHSAAVGAVLPIPTATDAVVQITLCTNGFEFLSSPVVSVSVPRGSDSEAVDFQLFAPSAGRHFVILTAYVGRKLVGGLDFLVEVGSKSSALKTQRINLGNVPSPRRKPQEITLSEAERRELEARSRAQKGEYRRVVRARIILYAAQGLTNQEIAKRLDTPARTVCTWRKRFLEWRLAGLEDGRSELPSRLLGITHGSEVAP